MASANRGRQQRRPMVQLSLRDLRAHIGRYVLTFLAVAIGVTFIGGVLTLTDTMTRSFHDLIADVNEGTDAWVRGEERFEQASGPGPGAALGATRPRIDAGLAGTVAQADGVAASAPWVQGYARVIGPEGEPYGNPSFGPPTFGASWVAVDELNPFDLTEGSRAPEGPGEIVLDKGTADGAGYEVGDTAPVQTQQGVREATVVGIATFGSADSPLGASFVLFDQATAQERLAEPGRVDGIGVVAEAGVSQEAVRDNVTRVLETGPASGAAADLEMLTGEELTEEDQQNADQQFGFIRTFLLVFAAIAVVVGMFVIYTSFSFIVAQRQRQVALLRAIGASRRQTLLSIVIEALLVGLLASAAGYALGVGLASVLSGLLVEDAATLVLLPTSVAVALGVGTLVTVASAAIPAWRASRVPPIAALREVAVDRSDRSGARLAVGAVTLALGLYALVRGLGDAGIEVAGSGIGLVFLGLHVLGPLVARPAATGLGSPLPALRGVVGRLAQRNAARNPKRTAYTGSALMIGLGVVSLLLVLNASVRSSIDDLVDNRFRGDLVVDGGGSGMPGSGLPGRVSEEIDQLPEVARAAGWRFGQAEIEGSTEPLGGLDPEAGFELFDVGVVAGDPADLDADGIGVFEAEAEAEGIEVGDTLEVTFAETGTQTFTVAALLETSDLTGTYMVPTQVFEEHMPSSGDQQVWIELAEGVAPGEAAPAIREVTDQAPTAELLDLDEFKEMTKERFQPIVYMMAVLVAFTILVAFIGIMNTLILSIVERAREIGLTRAVGATRQQIRASIRWEALLISVFGLMAALVLGVFFGWVIVQALAEEGFTVFEVPVVNLALVTAATAVATLVAAALPARWGARRPILPAIAAE